MSYMTNGKDLMTYTQGAWMVFLLSIMVITMPLSLVVSRLFPGPEKTWEYMITAPDDTELRNEISRLGVLGWEIAASRRATTPDGAAYEMILKRRRSATSPFVDSETESVPLRVWPPE